MRESRIDLVKIVFRFTYIPMHGFAYRNRARAHKTGKDRRGGGPFDDVKMALKTVWGKVPSPLKKLLPFIAAAGAAALGAKLLPGVMGKEMFPKIFGSVSSALRPRESEDIEEGWAIVNPETRHRFKIVRKGDA